MTLQTQPEEEDHFLKVNGTTFTLLGWNYHALHSTITAIMIGQCKKVKWQMP